jgi:hypothetical protein
MRRVQVNGVLIKLRPMNVLRPKVGQRGKTKGDEK